MKIGIITYDHPHRKTQDIVCTLMMRGYNNLHLIVLPWIERPNFKPIFQHRPIVWSHFGPEELSKNLGISMVKVGDQLIEYLNNNIFDKIIIGGCGIITGDISGLKIINSHPGYLPNARGLDAMKWSILNDIPLGVTTYYIGEGIDDGQLIDRQIIPIYFEDSFYSVAMRLYQTEIQMICNTIEQNAVNEWTGNEYHYYRRMPHHIEMKMIQKFEEIRKNSKSYITI